jgi:putative ABC transport system permease protein
MYLSTLSDSDCCDSELQIVAFDPGTDFTVGPWVQKAEGRTLPPYGVIVGNGLKYEPGDTALFFGRRFTVEGKLDKTGMGYDHTVFMTCDTAYDLVEKSNARNFFSIGGRTDLVSMITVKVREGYDANAVIDRITNLYGKDGISVYASDSLLIGASDSLRNFRFYGGLLSGLLLVSTVFALWCVFGITANERKREFGILRTLGASGIRLAVLIAGEAEILCAAGSVSGCLAAWYLAGAFGNYLADTFRVPFLQPRLPQMLLLAGECLLLTLAAGLAASCRIAWKTGLAEPYALLRENEAG